MAKTICTVSRSMFKAQAQPLKLVIMQGDKVLSTTYASPKDPDALDPKTKQPANKSLGWTANEKAVITVGDAPVHVQVGVNFTAIGSDPTNEDVRAYWTARLNTKPAGK